MGVVAWAVAVLSTVAGCSAESDGVGHDADTDSPLGWIDGGHGSGHLSVAPTSLDFGVVDVGSTSPAKWVTVTNLGQAVAIVPTLTGTGFLLPYDACPGILVTGSSCEIPVRFAPVAAGTVDEVLTIAPDMTVALRGSAPCEGRLTASDQVNLGTVPVNTSAKVLVQLAGPPCAIAQISCLPVGVDLTADAANTTCARVGPSTFPCSYAFVFRAATPGSKREAVICSVGGAYQTITVVTAEVIDISPDFDGGADYDTGAID